MFELATDKRKEAYLEAVKKCELKEGRVLLEDPFFTWGGKEETYATDKTSSEEKITQGPHKVLKSNSRDWVEGDIAMVTYQTKPVQIFLNQDLKSGYRVLIAHEDGLDMGWTQDKWDENWRTQM